MDLTRIGANRKEFRATAFADRQPSISIDAKSGSIKLLVRCADGMGAQGRYDYTIALSPTDLSELLNLVSAERTAFQPGELQACLALSAAALLRLVSAASCLPFQLAPTEEQIKLRQARARIEAKRAAETK